MGQEAQSHRVASHAFEASSRREVISQAEGDKFALPPFVQKKKFFLIENFLHQFARP